MLGWAGPGRPAPRRPGPPPPAARGEGCCRRVVSMGCRGRRWRARERRPGAPGEAEANPGSGSSRPDTDRGGGGKGGQEPAFRGRPPCRGRCAGRRRPKEDAAEAGPWVRRREGLRTTAGGALPSPKMAPRPSRRRSHVRVGPGRAGPGAAEAAVSAAPRRGRTRALREGKGREGNGVKRPPVRGC